MEYKILVINPGSTSTKIAVFENENVLFQETIRHDNEELKKYNWCMEQVEFRKEIIQKVLKMHQIDLADLTAICARGGMIPPCGPGALEINKAMIDYMYTVKKGAHVSNIGCVIAYEIGKKYGIPSYIYDGVTVDELMPIARISGIPELPHIVQGHTLNTRAMAMKCAKEILNKPFEQSVFIVAHIGGGISVRLIYNGKNIDACNDDNGAMSPERSGKISAIPLIQLCFSGKYTEEQLIKMVRGNGGFKAHLGTSNVQEVEERIKKGDERAKLVYEAMAYSVAKDIGQMATVADGKVDRIILTGGVSYSEYLTSYIEKKVSFIAPVVIMAGEFEMEALAGGALRVLTGEEKSKVFQL